MEVHLFDAIKNFVADLANGDKPSGGFADQDLRLATAALLVHAAAIDGTMSDIERDKLRSLLQQRFQLDDAAAGELIEQAAVADEKAVDLYHFTRLLNGSLDESERLRLIEMMWTIAYADGSGFGVRGQSDLARCRSARRIVDRTHRAASSCGRPERQPGVTPVTLITGASAGIGREFTHVFARHGHDLVLVARREQRLNELAAAIEASGRPKPSVLAIDLAQADAATRIGEALAARGLEPQTIVNNAGFGLVGRAAGLSRDEQLGMIDLNVRALTDLSLSFIDSLARHRGGLLNVASVAAFLPGPGSAVYYAGKAFVLSFSEALHRELAPQGIRVTCLCPGPVATEFQARAGIAKGKPLWPLAVSAERVAEAGYQGLMRGQRVVVPGLANKLLAALVPRFVPRNILLAQLDRRQLKRGA